MGDVVWKPEYGWLADFWDVVLGPRPGRAWRVYGLSDVLACDGSALVLLHDRLHDRGAAVEWQFVHAWGSEREVPLEKMRDRDLVFLGRPRPFHSAGVGDYARRLDGNAHAQFIEGPQGIRGRFLRCGGRLFEAQELSVPPLVGRCHVDYARLSYCKTDIGFERRALVGLCGISSFATWGIVRVLADDKRRLQLVEDVRAIAPWSPGWRPEEGFEICVRFSVDRDEQLKNILNEDRFDFRVEAVSVYGGDLRLRDHEVWIVLRPEPGRGGGSVRVGQTAFRLNDYRFHLLRELVEARKPLDARELCQRPHLEPKGPSAADARRAQGRVTRAVHDLNVTLAAVLGDAGKHPIVFVAGGYQLAGMRGVVEQSRAAGEGTAASPGRHGGRLLTPRP